MLKGKKILLGVCGGIAAYKAAFLIRLLVKEEAHVKVVMTKDATHFISSLTLSTLSKNPVQVALVDDQKNWVNHVELGLWADLLLIAPATANTISKMAHGLCDNLLLVTYLSSKCPTILAPAMDLDMYRHPSITKNLEILESFGNHILYPESGELASGLTGQGRLAEPASIVQQVGLFLENHENSFADKKLKGKEILITAGPTFEAIDPVRFIGNHSSGKMGYAIAEYAASQGAHITLVSGPTQQVSNHESIDVIPIKSASDMFEACKQYHAKADIVIFAAAVADYTPVTVNTKKTKKQSDHWEIKLKKTVDIAQTLGTQKGKNQLHIGFALETENEIAHASQKLRTKNLDFIVLNSLQDKGAGFGHDTNKIKIIDHTEQIETFPLKEKTAVAKDIVEKIITLIHA